MLTSEDRTFIRSLPLLLTASVLLIAGAYFFFTKENSVLSIAAATAGVFLLGMWSATAVSDWSKHHRATRKGDSGVGD